MVRPKLVHFSPGRVLLASFVFIITMGTMLLSLPQAREVDIPFLDIFFTAASTTCVTGLYTIPLSHFTLFGKCVILALIQIGGLGLMTLSFFIVSLVLKLGMTTKLMAGQLLEFELWGKIKTFLILIIGLTFCIELIGAILLYFSLKATFSSSDAIFYAIFHSISAFCNAGITLFDGNVISQHTGSFPLLVLSGLTIAGGIGFIVWYDLYRFFLHWLCVRQGDRSRFSLSLHTKLVLVTTAVLLGIGTFLIWGLEWSNLFKGKGFFASFVNAFFCSTSARSSGFSLLDLTKASQATLFVLLLLMFIGASPSSTGGGIKTTTFVLFLATMVAIVRQREDVEIFGRTVPTDLLYKAMAIIAIACSWVWLATFLLLITEQQFSFIQILFESVAAFATCGFSIGITSQLSFFGKIILVITMIVGRIGSLTLVLALRKERPKSLYRYPEEKVVIG